MKNRKKLIISSLIVIIVIAGVFLGNVILRHNEETASETSSDIREEEVSAGEEDTGTINNQTENKEDNQEEEQSEYSSQESYASEDTEQTETEKNNNGLPDYSALNPEDFSTDPALEENTSDASEDGSALEAPAGEFAGELQDSGLTIQGIQAYSGTFIETNEDSDCSNVATAMLTNTTDKAISLAIVTISAGENQWRFEASTIPAGASVIVQEKNGAQYEDITVSCESVEIGFLDDVSKMEEKISIEETEDGGLTVTNISSEDCPVLRIFYKMKEGDIYFGGITYAVTLENLTAGSSQIIYPSHYVSGYGEILMVREYSE